MNTATVTISYDIIVKRTIKVEAEDGDIIELLSMDNASYLQLPRNSMSRFDAIDVSCAQDVIQGFPKNITVIADYDDPDEIIIDK